MRRAILPILFLLIIAGVPTLAYAINAQIKVNQVPVAAMPEVSTPAAGATLCNTPPCSVTVRTTIADGTYGGVLSIIGGFAEATVQTNKTTIGASTSITTITNISGTFRYVGPTPDATIEFITSNTFALPTGVWTSGSNVRKGGFQCKKNTAGTYVANSCTPSTSTNPSATACVWCRSYGYTDEGYATRPDSIDPFGNLPASGVTVTMTSDVTFREGSTDKRREAVATSLSFTVPSTSIVEDGHFYLGNNQSENIPCEPLTVNIPTASTTGFTCANNETKTSKLVFTNVQPQDLMTLPATATTVSASDPAVMQIYLQADMPIDVQPNSDIVFDPTLYGGVGGWKGGINNDLNFGSSGTRKVVVLSTPNVDACKIEPFAKDEFGNVIIDPDTGLPIPLGFLSAAGSDFVPFVAALGPYYLSDGITCIGQIFQFDISDIYPTVPPIDGDVDAKRATCRDNPSATLIIQDVTQVSGYSVNTAKGKKKTYTVIPECTKDSKGNVTCTVTAPVGGTQIVHCSTPSGGSQ